VSTLGKTTDAEVLGTTYFTLATSEIADLRDSDAGGMAHGGEYETSLMMYLRPDLVVNSMINDGTRWDEHYDWGGDDLLDSGSLSVYRPLRSTPILVILVLQNSPVRTKVNASTR